MNRKANKEWIEYVICRHPKYKDLFDLDNVVIEGSGRKKKVTTKCNLCNKSFTVNGDNFRRGIKGCLHCTSSVIGKKYSYNTFLSKLKIKRPDIDHVVIGDYVNNVTETTFKCNKHNITYTSLPKRILNGSKIGCEKCIDERKNKRYSKIINIELEKLMNLFKERYGALYSFNEDDYVNEDSIIRIKCNNHNEEFKRRVNYIKKHDVKYLCLSCRLDNDRKGFMEKYKHLDVDFDLSKTIIMYTPKRYKLFCRKCEKCVSYTSHYINTTLKIKCKNCEVYIPYRYTPEIFYHNLNIKRPDFKDRILNIECKDDRTIDMSKEVDIMCNECGNVYKKSLSSILNYKRDCNICNNSSIPNLKIARLKIRYRRSDYEKRYDILDFKKKIEKRGNCSYIKSKCKKCGNKFWMRIGNIFKGQGCPKCKFSVGELKICDILESNDIEYIPQHSMEGCKHIRLLKFDFYLPEYNLCIEYHGDQHYESFDFSYGRLTEDEVNRKFRNIQLRDKIKEEFCHKNSIPLIVIPYWDKNKLEEIILKEIKKLEEYTSSSL